MKYKNFNAEALKCLKRNAVFSDTKIWNNNMDQLFQKYKLEHLKTLKSLAIVIWGETIKLNKMEEDIDDILLKIRINHTLTANAEYQIIRLESYQKMGYQIEKEPLTNNQKALDSLKKDNITLTERYKYYWVNPIAANKEIEKKVIDFYKNHNHHKGEQNHEWFLEMVTDRTVKQQCNC